MEENNTNNNTQPLNPTPANPNPAPTAAPTSTPTPTSAPATSSTPNTASAPSGADAIKQKLQTVSKNHLVNFAISALTKPTTTFKERLNGYSTFKSAWQLPLITTVIFTVFSLISTILSKVYTPAHKSFFGSQVDASWNWKKLEKIDWVQTIFSQFIAYLVPVLAITAVYYLISLIFKKKSNYFRLLTIAAVSSIPAIVTTFIFMPLITMVSINLGLIVMFAGFSYTSIMVYEGFNQEIGYEGDQRIFANSLVTIAIYAIAIFLFTSFLKQSLGSDLPFDSLNSLFNY